MERIKSENKKLNEENNELNEETKELRKELDEINDKLNNIYGEEYNEKKNEKEKLQKEIEEAEKKLNQFENILLNAQKTLDKLKEEIKSKEKNKEDLKNNIKECEKMMTQYEDESIKILQTMDNNKNEIKSLENQYTKQNKEIEKLKQAIASLREGKQEKENAIKEINEEIRKINRAIAAFNDKIEQNKTSFDKLIEDFGFIDDFDQDIKKINQGKINNNNNSSNNSSNINSKKIINDDDDISNLSNNSKNKSINKSKNKSDDINNNDDIEMKDANSNNENEDEEEEDDIIPSKKKASSKQYDKYFKSKELKLEFSQEEINKFISQTKDIEYILGINEAALKDMKPNMQAIIAYKNTLITLREREKDLQNTVEKLQKANDIYQNVKQRRQNEFMEGFNIINSKLIEMYRLLTKGGDAELELADSLDPFNEGITFTVRPNKKSWKSMSNLSGGEKTLSSLSLIFALHHYKPSPLYVMDEIDAALDFRNVSVIADYIKDRTKDSQFIIISLRNQMFENANELIGIYKTFDIVIKN